MRNIMCQAVVILGLIVSLSSIARPALGSVLGERPLLVILVEYSDSLFADRQFRNRYGARIFGPGNPSVIGYYRETSHGAFTYVAAANGETEGNADGIVWLPVKMRQDETPTGGEYRKLILQLANRYFDYGLYDANHDGVIQNHELTVLVIQANGGSSGKTAAADATVLDGVSLEDLPVAVMSERAPNYVLYHELAHTVDFYGATGRDLYNLRDGLRQRAVTWDVGGEGQISVRGSSTGEIALELDAGGLGTSSAVAAYRDQNGELSLVGYDLTSQADPLLGPVARAGLFSDLSVAEVTPLRVVTAGQTADGALKLIVWDMNFNWEFSRRGDYTGGNASDIEVTAVSSSRVVVAYRADRGRLKLTAFDVSRDGTLTRRGSYVAGEAEEINILDFSSTRVVTALRTEGGHLKVICFDLSADGEFTRQGDYEAGDATDIELTQVSPRRVATSVRGGAGNIMVILFNVDRQGNVTRLGSWEGGPVCDRNIQCTGNSAPILSDFTSRTSIVGGLTLRRLAVAWIAPDKLLQVRTLDYQEDGMVLSEVGRQESGARYLSTRLVRASGRTFTTIGQIDGQNWTGNGFGLLGGNTGNEMVHFDPYTKLKLGWLPYTEISVSTGYSLAPMGYLAAQAVILRVPGHRETEYFILEVRSRDSVYESGLKDEGLAIWHVDEEKEYPHPFVSLEWLGGSPGTALWSEADSGLDLYNGSSSPAGSRWSDFSLSGISISRIGEFLGGLSFVVTFR